MFKSGLKVKAFLSLEPSAAFRHDGEQVCYTPILFKHSDIQPSGGYNRSPMALHHRIQEKM